LGCANTVVIVDAHHHLWQPSRGDYGWLDSRVDPALAPIEREFLVEHYQALAAAHGIIGSVVVQAAPTVAETRWLLTQARASNGLIKGVVGWLDMAALDAPDVLRELAQDRKLLSIRPMLQDIPDVNWMLQPRLDPAFRALIEVDLAFDILIRPPYLNATLALLRRYPELRAIVDHCAKPAMAHGIWEPWAKDIREVARETSAYCKLSGLVTEARPDWKVDDLRRYVEHAIDCFGPDRIAWGSDWPVMLLNADYGRWLDAAKQIIASLAPSEQAGILGQNAVRFYRLADDPAS
jgi:L-fuconolactonase